jgi:hypothetical protein
MKPSITVLTRVYVVIADVLCFAVQRSSRFIAAAHVCGALVALFNVQCANATTIIGILDPAQHRVVLAADSFEVQRQAGSPLIGHRTICKILDEPNCAVTMVGQASTYRIDTPYPFNLADTARWACSQSGALAYRADTFLSQAQRVASPWFNDVKRHRPDWLASVKKDRGIFDAFFAGIVDGRVDIEVRGLSINDSNDMVPDGKTFNEIVFPTMHVVWDGAAELVMDYLRAHRSEIPSMDVPTLAKNLIELEIPAHPYTVGKPISVLEIRYEPNHGAISKWLERGACGSDHP